jgi:hypothetical protein
LILAAFAVFWWRRLGRAWQTPIDASPKAGRVRSKLDP